MFATNWFQLARTEDSLDWESRDIAVGDFAASPDGEAAESVGEGEQPVIRTTIGIVKRNTEKQSLD